MSFIEGVGRDQHTLFPEVLDDYIPADHPVRFIDAYVARLILGELGFEDPAETGRPGYDPGDLLRLYIYGYLNGVCSSRKLERESQRNVELMWLLRRLRPDHKTIAEFRRNNKKGIRCLFREFTLLCKKLDLFGAELVAIDGSKFRAVNAKRRNYSRKTLEEIVQSIDERIARYLDSVETNDKVEDTSASTGTSEELKKLTERAAQVRAMLAELDASGESQVSLTDPDSRAMKVRNGTDVCFNAQTAVDAKHNLIVAIEVTNEVTDRNWLSPMAIEAKKAMGAESLTVVADKGYSSAREVEACLAANITPHVPKPETSANKALGLYTKNDFRYDRERDLYICPANKELTFRSEARELGRDIRYYRTSACKSCALRAQCTRSDSRRISRTANEHVLEEMNARVAANPELMRRRKAIVEHPFGTIKRWMNQAYFLMRGLEKVRVEFSLSAFAYNLKRVLSIVGVAELLKAIA
ncbi:MAG TPA: IS1182 family transposase [Gemmatimonadaceae bacterium]|nr:IS1182 family transposase [Gemmatimonadaceae bacterium]